MLGKPNLIINFIPLVYKKWNFLIWLTIEAQFGWPYSFYLNLKDMLQ